MQLTHYNSKFSKKTFPITLVCDTITNAPNIGSMFRTADAFGIENIIFCGDSISIGKRVTKTSRSTEKYVNYSLENDINAVVQNFRSLNYLLIGLEITDKSESLSTFKLETTQPIALILGNEKFGISESLLKECHHVIHIEMFGQNSSMNVVQATSIVLYELTQQFIYLQKN